MFIEKKILKFCLILFPLLIINNQNLFSQDDSTSGNSVEIFLIENYVTPDVPHKFRLSFVTSAPAKSKVIINGKNEVKISGDLKEKHNIEIDLSKYKFEEEYVPFIIEVEDSAGSKYESENYEFEFPQEVKAKSESNFLLLCLFGGAVFGLPSPAYVKWGDKDYFSLTKEIPLLFIRSSGYAYPAGYFSAEYSYIFHSDKKNFLRIGYKHIIEIPGLEYVSPGINGFTNFKGFNGISPELSIGLFKIFNTFTVYARYRFNAKPGDIGSEFHELSIGLYSGFFAIYL